MFTSQRNWSSENNGGAAARPERRQPRPHFAAFSIRFLLIQICFDSHMLEIVKCLIKYCEAVASLTASFQSTFKSVDGSFQEPSVILTDAVIAGNAAR